MPMQKMSADEFLDWAEAQGSGRYQLIDGEVVATAPEGAEHSHVKRMIADALDAAIAQAKLPCRAFVDGQRVKIDDKTVFEPDALVNCGASISRESLIAPNPIIVVEVVSPASARRDLAQKFTNYFRHPGVHHYLVVVLDNRSAILHSRTGGDTLITRIAGVGESLTFSPPGIEVEVAALFGDLDTALA